MAEITASLVKALREQTGAGMMDCKKALAEAEGDMEGAVDWLRTKGLAAAAKKAGRVAAEGLVAVAVDGTRGAVVEINSETDFVARNDAFQGFAREVAGIALAEGGDLAAVVAAPTRDGKSVANALTDLIAALGENMAVRRAAGVSVGDGVVASYIHNAIGPEVGRIGVLVGLESGGDKQKLAALGKQIAMHIAAASPKWVDVADIDPAAVERERSVLSEQAKESGRPENVIAKMVEGRLRKFYEEVTLLQQTFVIDNERKIAKVLEEAGRDVGAPVSVTGFERFVLGEGIEKEAGDFAAEVAATLGNR